MNANPYPSVAVELELPAHESLTDSSADELRTLLEQNEGNRTRIAGLRTAQERKIDDAKKEMASLDRLLEQLNKTGDQYRSLLNQPPAILPMQLVQEPKPVAEVEPVSVWDGNDAPQTGSFAAVPDLALDPDKNLEAFAALHDAQDAREGKR